MSEQIEPSTKQPAPKKKSGGWFKLAVLLLLAVIAALLLLSRYAPEQEDEGRLERELVAELGLLPGMDADEIQDRLNRKVAEGMVNLSINPTPVFPDGTSPGNLRIENIPGNRYPFTVTLVRDDTGDTILKTGLIDPGYYVDNIKLSTDLPAGKYLCVANFTVYDAEGVSELGEMGTQVLLTVNS